MCSLATSDGTLYMGNIDPRDGGECRIAKEYRLFAGPGDVPQDDEKAATVRMELEGTLCVMSLSPNVGQPKRLFQSVLSPTHPI